MSGSCISAKFPADISGLRDADFGHESDVTARQSFYTRADGAQTAGSRDSDRVLNRVKRGEQKPARISGSCEPESICGLAAMCSGKSAGASRCRGSCPRLASIVFLFAEKELARSPNICLIIVPPAPPWSAEEICYSVSRNRSPGPHVGLVNGGSGEPQRVLCTCRNA